MDSAARTAIDRTPGSSPWDWETFPGIRAPNDSSLGWYYDQDDGRGHEYVVLRDAETSAYKLLLGVGCHPFVIDPGRLGVWFAESGSVRIVCLEVKHLPDLPRPARFTKLGLRFHAGAAPLASLPIPPNLPSVGTHKLGIPSCLQDVTELLMVAPYGSEQATTIFSLRPSAGELRLYPQLWFDEMFRGGWESMMKIARHPERGSIIGSGPRIRPFELTEDARQLARWL